MSSPKFVAELCPDRRLRSVLGLSVVLMLVLGNWVIVSLPVNGWLRLLVTMGWSISLGLQYFGQFSRQRQIRRIRLHADGSVLLLGPDGCWSSATVGGDSTVLARFAWLQLDLPGGGRHAELLQGNCRESEGWRRFQVIWKQLPSRPASRLGSAS